MKLLKKLKKLILPEDIDFFGSLAEQSEITEEIIKKLELKFISQKNTDIHDLIKKAKKSKKEKLKLLEKTFITPVDREAISRSYAHLYWITLSVEHFINELKIYQINDLKEYESIFKLLIEQIENITKSYQLFNKKKYDEILKIVNKTIHLDNQLVLEYSKNLNIIFGQGNKELTHILKHREILSQLKEISKRIHFSANQIEDIVFKVD